MLHEFYTTGCLHRYSVLPYGSSIQIPSVSSQCEPKADIVQALCIITYIGRVLNRFSKDIGFLDDLLPLTFLHYVTVGDALINVSIMLCSLSYISPLQLLLRFLAIVTTAAAANAYIVIPVVFVIVVFLCLRWYYLKTSRDVKRLEAICE